MDLVKDDINKSLCILVICNENNKEEYEEKSKNLKTLSVVASHQLKQLNDNSQDVILCTISKDTYFTKEFLSTLINILKPDGKLVFPHVETSNNIEFDLKTNGFVNISTKDNHVICFKPKYEIGSAVKLNLKQNNAANVWKLDDTVDDEIETIDPDNLLDEDDLKKPDPSSLRVCGTTGKRKACKDCSCGLADELAAEAQKGLVVDTTNAPKSSCGSCYLGDAFRCATCPYLGMPAFKPGEKVQLINQPDV